MGFSDLVSFLTIIPVGGRTVQGAASSSHWLPVVGLLVGVPAGLLGWLVSIYAGPLAGAAAALAAACIITGLHHVDGLADFADGLMARGSRERRIAAMRDKATGAGGAAAVALCLLLAAAAASQRSGADLLVVLVLAEVAAKYSVVVTAAAGRAAAAGGGSLFCEATGAKRLAAATCVWLVPGILAMWLVPGSNLGLLAILGAASAAAAAVMVTAVAQNAFGGVTGDVMGAAHETGRAAAIIAVVSAWAV